MIWKKTQHYIVYEYGKLMMWYCVLRIFIGGFDWVRYILCAV